MSTLATPVARASAEHVARFEQKITVARQAVAGLPADESFNQLLNIIHRPGWTTIAEGQFFEAALDSITAHSQLLTNAHQQLLAASDSVGRE